MPTLRRFSSAGLFALTIVLAIPGEVLAQTGAAAGGEVLLLNRFKGFKRFRGFKGSVQGFSRFKLFGFDVALRTRELLNPPEPLEPGSGSRPSRI